MKAKISKAQHEVWKEKAYQKIKGLPLDKAIQSIIDETKSLADELDNKRRKRTAK